MATKKPAAKPVKKSAPAKATAKPAKKAAPAKKPSKPAPKAKPAAKKPVAKASKPAPKKAPQKATKPVAKKIVAPKAKVVAKPLPKTAKPSPTPASKKPVAVQKPVAKPMAKKTEEKKPAAKEVAKAAPAVKAIAKHPKDIKITPAKPVVLPKINTKTSRKYQPDFTKSVLDQAKNDPGAPIVRYTDAELMEFRELIQRKLEAAKKELNYLQGLITRKDEMGGDESENRYMTMEDGSLSMEREQLSQMASRQITFIDHLEKAIMRIENKTYGICRVTGKLIDKARLRAVPHATLSIEAKMGIVK
jgi:RNA polymerase-binding transcription factor DksA